VAPSFQHTQLILFVRMANRVEQYVDNYILISNGALWVSVPWRRETEAIIEQEMHRRGYKRDGNGYNDVKDRMEMFFFKIPTQASSVRF
jgi:hypothetical protein